MQESLGLTHLNSETNGENGDARDHRIAVPEALGESTIPVVNTMEARTRQVATIVQGNGRTAIPRAETTGTGIAATVDEESTIGRDLLDGTENCLMIGRDETTGIIIANHPISGENERGLRALARVRERESRRLI